MLRIDGASAGGAGAAAEAMIAVTSPTARPQAVGVHLEGGAEIDRAQARIVVPHPSDVPELPRTSSTHPERCP